MVGGSGSFLNAQSVVFLERRSILTDVILPLRSSRWYVALNAVLAIICVISLIAYIFDAQDQHYWLVLLITDGVVNIFFSLEVLIRLHVYRLAFFRSIWRVAELLILVICVSIIIATLSAHLFLTPSSQILTTIETVIITVRYVFHGFRLIVMLYLLNQNGQDLPAGIDLDRDHYEILSFSEGSFSALTLGGGGPDYGANGHYVRCGDSPPRTDYASVRGSLHGVGDNGRVRVGAGTATATATTASAAGASAAEAMGTALPEGVPPAANSFLATAGGMPPSAADVDPRVLSMGSFEGPSAASLPDSLVPPPLPRSLASPPVGMRTPPVLRSPRTGSGTATPGGAGTSYPYAQSGRRVPTSSGLIVPPGPSLATSLAVAAVGTSAAARAAALESVSAALSAEEGQAARHVISDF